MAAIQRRMSREAPRRRTPAQLVRTDRDDRRPRHFRVAADGNVTVVAACPDDLRVGAGPHAAAVRLHVIAPPLGKQADRSVAGSTKSLASPAPANAALNTFANTCADAIAPACSAPRG